MYKNHGSVKKHRFFQRGSLQNPSSYHIEKYDIPDFNIVNSYGSTKYEMARSLVLHYATARALSSKSIDNLLCVLQFCKDYNVHFSIFVGDYLINVRICNDFFDFEQTVKFKYNVQQKHYYKRNVSGNPDEIAA